MITYLLENITKKRNVSVTFKEKIIPLYTGEYTIDTEHDSTYDYMYLLTSGTLSAKNNMIIDAFLCGGGGCGCDILIYSGFGGGGGYTKNIFSYNLKESITCVIGDGGSTVNFDGFPTLFGNTHTASGGRAAHFGGHGGSGGAAGIGWGVYLPGQTANGGTDGSNGSDGKCDVNIQTYAGGTGQGTSTRPFLDPSFPPYAGGGGGNKNFLDEALGLGGYYGGGNGAIYMTSKGVDGLPNTGGGGGAGLGNYNKNLFGSGGSGVIILRYKK